MAKVKGTGIVNSVRILRRHKEAARKVLPPGLHHYLSERVLAASWYPEEDMIPLARAVAQVLKEPEYGFYEKAGRFSAQAHAQGVYRHLARVGDNESLARRVLVLWSSQHDTGSMELVSEEKGGGRVVMRNFGSPSRELCAISSGYIAETFEISGCKNVRVRKQTCCLDAAAECCWQVSWDD